MRKITLLLSFIFFSVLAKAQDLPVNPDTEKVTFMEVVDATGLNAKELYKVMKEWADAKGLKLKEDKADEGEIIFSGTLSVPYERVKGKPEPGNVLFTTYLFGKDDKYRFIFTDFSHEGINASMSGEKLENPTPACGPSISNTNWVFIKKKTHASIDELIEDLKKKIKATQNDPAKNKDW